MYTIPFRNPNAARSQRSTTPTVHNLRRLPFTLALLVPMLGAAGTLRGQGAPHWVGAWMASPCAPSNGDAHRDEMALNGDTVRQIAHLSIGGLAVRLRFSNTFGTMPLTLRSVRVAPAASGGEVAAGTDAPVLFAGKSELTIAPGASAMSDAVNLPAQANADLAVSFFVPGSVVAPAVHYTALQTSYVAPGDQTSAGKLEKSRKITLDLILTAVDVASRTAPGAIVALGSSTTDGTHSTPNTNRRWTDDLSSRLRAAEPDATPSVLNAGIAGNRVLNDSGGTGGTFGQSALTRFYRDVLAQSGVKWIVVFEGGNDIRWQGSNVAPEQLIKAFQLMASEAHGRKLKFMAGTITPFEHAGANDDPAWEAIRLKFNQWVRTSKDIDGFVDFDRATRDPQHQARLLPAFDSGDHLHPNDAGYQAMADSIDLSLFQ